MAIDSCFSLGRLFGLGDWSFHHGKRGQNFISKTSFPTEYHYYFLSYSVILNFVMIKTLKSSISAAVVLIIAPAIGRPVFTASIVPTASPSTICVFHFIKSLLSLCILNIINNTTMKVQARCGLVKV